MKLADYLRVNDITTTDFAKELGVTQSTVSRWCTGRRTPSLDQAARIERLTRGKVSCLDLALAS